MNQVYSALPVNQYENDEMQVADGTIRVCIVVKGLVKVRPIETNRGLGKGFLNTVWTGSLQS